jgi:energy-coupling factor transporter ATP-binding protein EcfA2
MAFPPFIAIRGLSISFPHGARPALSALDLSIPSGSCCAVLGATGSGRTTLLHAIGGLLGSTHGDLSAHGTIAIGAETHRPIPRSVLFPQTGMLIQDPRLQISGMTETVEDEIAWTLENAGIPPAEAREHAVAEMKKNGLIHLRGRRVRKLSGGETHRVVLASILVARPSLLLLDEPCASLDQSAVGLLAKTIRECRDQVTTIFTDSDADLALHVADQIVVLREGVAVFCGLKHAFLEHIAQFAHDIPAREWADAGSALGRLPERIRRRFSRVLGAG